MGRQVAKKHGQRAMETTKHGSVQMGVLAGSFELPAQSSAQGHMPEMNRKLTKRSMYPMHDHGLQGQVASRRLAHLYLLVRKVAPGPSIWPRSA